MKRIALVIGNGSYIGKGIANLPNAISDAKKIARDLTSRGFETELHTDLDAQGMTQVIDTFLGRNRDSTNFFVFYFAGHGCEQHGVNYLYPVDLPSVSASAIPNFGIPLTEILRGTDGSDSAKVLILDCCRNSEASWTADERARFEELAIHAGHRQAFSFNNVLIAYSTSAGEEAFDGHGTNGPYCSRLSEMLLKHRIKVEDVFKEVGMSVAADSKGRQRPWFYSNLSLELTFSDLPEVVPLRTIQTPLRDGAMGLVKDPNGQRAVAFGSASRKAWYVDGIVLDGHCEFKEKIELLTTCDNGFVVYDELEQLLVQGRAGKLRSYKLGLGQATFIASSKTGERIILGRIAGFVLVDFTCGQIRVRECPTPNQSWYAALFLDDENVWLLGPPGRLRKVEFDTVVTQDVNIPSDAIFYSICRIDKHAVAICGSGGLVMKVQIAANEIIWRAQLGETKRTPAGRTESILNIAADNEIIKRFLFEPEKLTLEQGERLRDALASNNLMSTISCVSHPIVIVASDEGLLYFLDQRDGQLIETIDSSAGSGNALQGICFPERDQLAVLGASGAIHMYSLSPIPYRQALNYVDQNPWSPEPVTLGSNKPRKARKKKPN